VKDGVRALAVVVGALGQLALVGGAVAVVEAHRSTPEIM
jgi:hypothetical protein